MGAALWRMLDAGCWMLGLMVGIVPAGVRFYIHVFGLENCTTGTPASRSLARPPPPSPICINHRSKTKITPDQPKITQLQSRYHTIQSTRKKNEKNEKKKWLQSKKLHAAKETD